MNVIIFALVIVAKIVHYIFILFFMDCPKISFDYFAWGMIFDAWFLFCFYCMMFRLDEVYEFLEMWPKVFKWNFRVAALGGWTFSGMLLHHACTCMANHAC